MKKTIICSLALVGSLTSLHANKTPDRPIIEARFSYFIPNSSLLRHVYGSGIDYQIEATVPFWKGINAWIAADYFHKDGHSLGDHQKTWLQIVPLTLGVKYIYNICDFSVYGGLGMRYFFVHTRNHSDFVDPSITRSGMGGVAEVGGMYCLWDHWVFDVFGNWSYKRLHNHTSRTNVSTHGLNVGGWNIGVGVGYKF